ncbi:MAG: hypothetical protein V1744_05215 [Candidatus Altiarchaeota archaeon]
MASKKKVTRKVLTLAQKTRIKNAIKNAEKKLVENYQKAVKMSGKDWKKQAGKYRNIAKKNVQKAGRRIETEVRRNPAGAALASAAIGAIVGAFVMSKLKKR